MLLSLKNGDLVLYQGQVYTIKAPINLQKLLLIDRHQNTLIAKIKDLSPVVSETINNDPISTLPKTIPAHNLIDLPVKAWEQLTNRERLLHRLLDQGSSLKLVKEIAKELNLQWRQVYNLAKKYKQSGGNLSGVTIKNNQGGKNKSRLLPTVEMLLQDAIEELYCDRQKIKPSALIEEISQRCRLAGLKAPSQVTVRKRINSLPKYELVMARSRSKEARSLNPIKGNNFVAEYPLQEVQIDHTKVDLIVVDDLYRQPIGRPYLTIAIDVFSRCITGFCLTLEPPSATSVGLCLLHSVFKKDQWLIERKINGEWSIWGKPELIYVDNGSEFHSEALIRGCEFHGIKIKYRPPGAPHYGGIVERVIGTFMQLVHQIPGTTFSNLQERGSYDPEQRAILTLAELERWMSIAIVNYYHQKIHSSLLMPPIEKYRLGIVGNLNNRGIGYPKAIADQEAFLIDFFTY